MITVDFKKKTAYPRTKYEQLKNELREGIISKRFKLESPLPSENDLIEETGMSRSTIRLALEGLEREGFIFRVRGKGTFINEKLNDIRATTGNNKSACNFVVPINRIFASTYLEDSSIVPLLRSMEDVLRLAGFRLSVVFFDENKEKEQLQDLLDSPNYCDGLVLLDGILDKDIASQLVKSKFPHVSIDQRAERLGLNTVCDHAIDGMRQAISHLKSLGHKSIVFLGAAGGSGYGFFKTAIIEAEMPISEPIHIDDTVKWFDRNVACDVFGKWLDNEKSSTAVICQIDTMALGAVDAMNQRGIRVGRDISIVGHDNIEEKDARIKTSPILTTVDSSTEIIGKRCGELLLNQILQGQHQIVHEYLPIVKLIVRQTTGPCLPGMAKAKG
jgi:DNA-binding LacI/PurR family transcriptional regulator